MIRVMLLLLAVALPARAAERPSDYAWQPHLGATVPLAAPLRESDGTATTLGAAFAGKPVVLDLGYFRCPTLCGAVRSDMLAALRESALSPSAYSLVTLSIDAREPPEAAREAKVADLRTVSGADPATWHYLTGDASPVERAVGFRTRWDEGLGQWLHPTGLVVLTVDGRVSSYLQGVGYAGGDLRAAILRAGSGGVARAALPILLLCFHFDEATGRYTLAIEKLVKLAGALTVLTLGTMLVLLHRAGRRTAS